MATEDVMSHISGMPASLMCEIEQRLVKRIMDDYLVSKEEEFDHPQTFVMKSESDDCFETPIGEVLNDGHWRYITEREASILARHILYRMIDKRIRDGRQFDSILESSRKYFATAMILRELEPK